MWLLFMLEWHNPQNFLPRTYLSLSRYQILEQYEVDFFHEIFIYQINEILKGEFLWKSSKSF